MSLYNGPPRGGNRGGKDQFSWENVKADIDREFYLGHSVKATVGRWQKHKDVFWYTREKKEFGEQAQAEVQAVKAKEEQLMMQALGLKPKRSMSSKEGRPKLEKHEMAQLLKKRSEELPEGQQGDDPDRVKGLGHTPGAIGGIEGRDVLQGEGVDLSNPAPINKQKLFAQQLLQRQVELKASEKNKQKLRKESKKEKRSKKDKKKKKRTRSHSSDDVQLKKDKLDQEKHEDDQYGDKHQKKKSQTNNYGAEYQQRKSRGDDGINNTIQHNREYSYDDKRDDFVQQERQKRDYEGIRSQREERRYKR